MQKLILITMIMLSGFVYAQKDTLDYTKDEMNSLFAKVDSLLHQSALLDSLQALRGEIAGKQDVIANIADTSKYLKEVDSTLYTTVNDLNVGLATKQATLISGVNIKTVDGTPLLGSGDVSVATDTTGFWAVVNGLVDDALAESDTLIGTGATLDSLILAFWNDELGGVLPDSVIFTSELAAGLAGKLNIEDSTDYATTYELGLKLAASTYTSFKNTLAGGTTDQALTKVDATDYNWNWSTVSGGVTADTIPNNFEFDDVTDATLSQYYTDYIVVTGCDSARFYPASGDTIRIGALGTKRITPVWVDNGDTVYTFCVASGSNSTTTRSIVYAANQTPVDSFNVTTIAAVGPTPFATLDFEEGNLTDLTTAGTGTDTSKTYVHSGTYSMKYTASNSYSNKTFSAKDSVYTVFYIYLSSSVVVATGGNLYTAYYGNDGTDLTIFAMDWDDGVTDLLNRWLLGWNNANLTVDTDTEFATGEWIKIKMFYKKGTGANAVHKIWINDTLLLNVTDGTSTATINNFRITTESWTSASPIFFVDDINLYDEDPD